MQELKVLAKVNEKMEIVIGEKYIADKNFVPIIRNYGKLFKLDGTPITEGCNRLYSRNIAIVNEKMDEARKMFDILANEAPVINVEAPFVPPVASPAPAEDPAYNAFQKMMAEAMAKCAVENVGSQVVAFVEEHIKKTYGSLPQLHEFKIPDKMPKQRTGVFHKDFDRMLALMQFGENVYLYGPAGTGKSYIAQQIAEILELNFYPQSKVDFSYDITGFNDATGKFVETNFFKAWKNGGVFLLDELDRSDQNAVITLNNALASDTFTFACGTIPKHKDFHCVATGNTIGTGANMQYATAQKMDESTRNRFYFFNVDYDREIERMFANGDDTLVDFAHDFREACKNIGFEAIFSYRDIKRVKQAQSLFRDISLQDIFNMVSFVGIDTDTKTQIYEALNDKNNYYATSLK